MHLLLIEDDRPLAEALGRALRQTSYAVDMARTATEAEAMLRTGTYDLVILDLGLPDRDGAQVLKHLRHQRKRTPVLVLSARDAVDERVRLLDLGADDYVVKPVVFDELEARVRALIRRSQGIADSMVAIGKLRLDIVGKRAIVDDCPLELNSREWAVLEYLGLRVGRIVGKDQLLQAIYDWGEANTENAIEKIVSRIRGKLPPGVISISTIRGLGYTLEPVPDETE
jgi:two-component system OmpR family response regulator